MRTTDGYEFHQPLAILPHQCLRRVGIAEPGQRGSDELVSGDLAVTDENGGVIMVSLAGMDGG